MYLNKIFVLGNLTRDPELKSLPGGSAVCNFGVATNRTFTGKDGKKQEQVEFHNVVAFARQAEIIAQYLKKGSSILVEGRIQTRSWEKDGAKQYRTEVVVENMQLGPRLTSGAAIPVSAEIISAEEMDDRIDEALGVAKQDAPENGGGEEVIF